MMAGCPAKLHRFRSWSFCREITRSVSTAVALHEQRHFLLLSCTVPFTNF